MLPSSPSPFSHVWEKGRRLADVLNPMLVDLLLEAIPVVAPGGDGKAVAVFEHEGSGVVSEKTDQYGLASEMFTTAAAGRLSNARGSRSTREANIRKRRRETLAGTAG